MRRCLRLLRPVPLMLVARYPRSVSLSTTEAGGQPPHPPRPPTWAGAPRGHPGRSVTLPAVPPAGAGRRRNGQAPRAAAWPGTAPTPPTESLLKPGRPGNAGSPVLLSRGRRPGHRSHGRGRAPPLGATGSAGPPEMSGGCLRRSEAWKTSFSSYDWRTIVCRWTSTGEGRSCRKRMASFSCCASRSDA